MRGFERADGQLLYVAALAETGDVARFIAKDKFASYNGTAPIDASFCEQARPARGGGTSLGEMR